MADGFSENLTTLRELMKSPRYSNQENVLLVAVREHYFYNIMRSLEAARCCWKLI